MRKWLTREGAHGTISLVAAALLLAGSGSAIAWAAVHQQHAPAPLPGSRHT